MKVPVYKALDKPASFLGLKGSYVVLAGIGVLAALIIAVMVKGRTNGIIAILTFAAVTGAAYLAVMWVQSHFTNRELKKHLAGKMLPRFVTVDPVRMRHHVIRDEKKDH